MSSDPGTARRVRFVPVLDGDGTLVALELAGGGEPIAIALSRLADRIVGRNHRPIYRAIREAGAEAALAEVYATKTPRSFAVEVPRDHLAGTPALFRFAASVSDGVVEVEIDDDMWLLLAELSVEDIEHYVRLFGDHARDVVFETGGDATIRWVSPSVVALLGFTQDEMVGQNALSVIAEEDVERYLNERERAIATGNSVDVEVRAKLRGGGKRWISLRSEPLVGPDGQLVGIAGGAHDLHAEVTLRRALRTLSASSSIITGATSEQQLLEEICEMAVRESGYAYAAYVRDLPSDEIDVRPVATSIEHRSYSEQTIQLLIEQTKGHGPVGSAMTSGSILLSRNLLDDRRFEVMRELIKEHGFGSMVAVPVIIGGAIDGSLCVYAYESDGFDDRVIEVIDELGTQVGTTIARLRERHALERTSVDYRLLAENASDVVVETDHDAIVRWVSPSAERLYGYRPEDLVGASAFSFVAPADLPAATEAASILFEQGTPATFECRILMTGGDSRWFSVRGHPIVAEGQVVAAVLSLSDCHAEVTTRRALTTVSAASAVLFRAENEDELLTEMSGAAVRNGGYRSAWYGRRNDDEARSITIVACGEGSREILESMHFSWGDGPNGACSSGEALRTGRTTHVVDVSDKGPFKDVAGAWGVKSSLALPVFVSGLLDGVFVVHSNEEEAFDERSIAALENLAADLGFGLGRIRERLRLNEALMERDRARAAQQESTRRLNQIARLESLGQLAGGVAHDFNNLLTVVLINASLVQRQLTSSSGKRVDPARLTEDVDRIVLAAEQASKLTHQLLTFARREPGQPQPVDLNSIIEETCGMLRHLFSSSISLTCELEPDLWSVSVDAGQVSQVLMNLIVNSRDAMPEGGRIVIGTANVSSDVPGTDAAVTAGAGRAVRFWVSDEGTGMPPEVVDRVFEPFFTTKPLGYGTGLGLATVYGIVAQANGTVVVDSAPGEGTTVTVSFPATVAEEEDPNLALAASDLRRVVLVVEPEPARRDGVATALEVDGYAVFTASGAEADFSDAALRSSFDLAIIDESVLPPDPEEVLRTIRSANPTAQVVVTTSDPARSRDRFAATSWVSVLAKPFAVSTLRRSVEVALEPHLLDHKGRRG